MPRPTEKWLSHEATDEQFGEAMMFCQDASGSCVTTGRCSYEGDCFKTDFIGYREAKKVVEDAIKARSHGGRALGAHALMYLSLARDYIEHTYRRKNP